MMHMDAKKVKSIQGQFHAAGGSVDIYTFVRIMRKHLPQYNIDASKAGLNELDEDLFDLPEER